MCTLARSQQELSGADLELLFAQLDSAIGCSTDEEMMDEGLRGCRRIFASLATALHCNDMMTICDPDLCIRFESFRLVWDR